MSYYSGGSVAPSPRGKKRPASNPGLSQGAKMIIVILVVGVLVAGFFAYLQFSKTGEKLSAECMIVVDRTGSTVDQSVQDQYVGYARQAIEGCQDLQANVLVTYFANDGQKLRTVSGHDPIALYRPVTHRKSVGEKQQAEQVEKAVDAVESVFDQPIATGGHGSDIAAALGTAAIELGSQADHDDVDDVYLIVITDGYQTGQLSVRKAFRNEDSPVKPLVNKAVKLGQVPDFTDMQLSFVGVASGLTGEDQAVPAWFDAKVGQFWSAVVQRGGGRLCAYNSSMSVLPASC